MAWYPGAIKMELQPESDSQPAIRPTHLIFHSIVAPWTARRTYEYWRDSTNLESHFGVDYNGDVGQYIGTETRADANAGANRRADGTGAVSVETASNTSASDPWNEKQIEDLIGIGVWMHEHHGVPLRICRSHADPGFGYHSMFPQWSTSGTACPGKARIAQFKEVVFPGIVARATGAKPPEEDEVALSSADIAKVADAVVQRMLDADAFDAPKDATDYKPSGPMSRWTGRTVFRDLVTRVRNTDKRLVAVEKALTALTKRLG